MNNVKLPTTRQNAGMVAVFAGSSSRQSSTTTALQNVSVSLYILTETNVILGYLSFSKQKFSWKEKCEHLDKQHKKMIVGSSTIVY